MSWACIWPRPSTPSWSASMRKARSRPWTGPPRSCRCARGSRPSRPTTTSGTADSENQARTLRAAIADRLQTLGLELHPEKTKIAFCQDANRPGESEHTSFDFLGYTFRGRMALGPRGFFVSFAPAISAKARKAVGQKVRAWHLNRRSGTDLSGLAHEINPQVRGWIGYYGAFYRSELYSLARRIDAHLLRWAMQKFKRLRGKPAKASAWLDAVRQHRPRLFAHWHLLAPPNGRHVGAV